MLEWAIDNSQYRPHSQLNPRHKAKKRGTKQSLPSKQIVPDGIIGEKPP